MQTDCRFRNHYSALYKLLVSTLAPCGIRRRDPPTSCILLSLQQFPCGTLAATILQVDNCIVATECAALLLVYIMNCWESQSLNVTQVRPGGRRGCAPIPYHLLSRLGMYAFLLSPARGTHCTTYYILLFLTLLPHSICRWHGK